MCFESLILHFLGSIVYLKVMGRSIVVINDAKYAFDMLAMKSRYFSDRPKFVMGIAIDFERESNKYRRNSVSMVLRSRGRQRQSLKQCFASEA